MSNSITLFWFRRDFRLDDNAALYKALNSGKKVQPIFIFDQNILDKLEDKNDRRVTFIHDRISSLKQDLNNLGADLWMFYGKPIEIFQDLMKKHNIHELYANKDYEPYARERDKAVFKLMEGSNIRFRAFKDHVIFEKEEVLKDDGDPYVVFTPYSKTWKEHLKASHLESYPTSEVLENLYQTDATDMIELSSMGFTKHAHDWGDNDIDISIVENYDQTRDTPSINGTTRLSVHLRFGTVSIRKLARIGQKHNEKWLNELIWRDFYQSILWHFPHVVNVSFRKKHDRIPWRDDEEGFQAWCDGKTGYPIVDAGMRELNETGFMHNRVRMIVASFLVKHLLIDWRLGEAYFARKLLDFELASNNGGWQWAAGSGVDAAPYFRVFNPYLQTDKYDSEKKYIKKWVAEFGTTDYPEPIVDHKYARERAISTYKEALNG